MQLDKIDKAILKVILEFNSNEPVGFHSIDRMLIINHTEFILSGKLGSRLKELTNKSLIYVASDKGGYLLTEKGKNLLV
jgi:DNA-binding HxlR family transcriptional regulator